MSDRILAMKNRQKLRTNPRESVLFSDNKNFQDTISNEVSSILENRDAMNLTDFDLSINISEKEFDALLDDIHKKWDAKKFDDLLEKCQKETLRSVAVPFGLGKVLSAYDKTGGNVDTINNVRGGSTTMRPTPDSSKGEAQLGADCDSATGQPIYATEEALTEYKETEKYGEKEKKDTHGGDKNYNQRRDNLETQRQEGNLQDAATGETISAEGTQGNAFHTEHVVSTYEIYNDPGRILAEIDAKDLANIEENIVALDPSLNQSKGEKTVTEYIQYLKKNHEKNQKRIAILKEKTPLSGKEEKELNRREKQESVDAEKLKKVDELARESINKAINKKYYTSSKFISNLAKTGAIEAGKMGFQQATGLLLVNLFEAIIIEIKDSYINGFVGTNQAFLQALGDRLHSIGVKVLKDWKTVVIAFKDGAISGFLSNLITTAINAFLTTAKRIARLIREGIMSLFQAFKMLLFCPKEMTLDQAADAALKLIATGVLTGVGIMIEDTFQILLGTMPYAPMISAALVGGIVGILSAMVAYSVDKLDLFGVHQKEKHAFTIKILQARIESIDLSVEDMYEDAMRPRWGEDGLIPVS